MKCKINKYCLRVLPSKTVIWRPFYALFCLAVIYFADLRIQQIAGSVDLSGPAFPFPALLYEDSTSSTIKLKRRIVRVFCGEFFHSMSTNLAQTHSPWPHPPFFVISNLILTSKNMRSRKTPQIATLPKSWKHNTSTPYGCRILSSNSMRSRVGVWFLSMSSNLAQPHSPCPHHYVSNLTLTSKDMITSEIGEWQRCQAKPHPRANFKLC